MKKITSVLLTVVMLLSMICMPAQAIDASEWIHTTVSTYAETGELVIILTARKATTNGRIVIEFDSSRLVYLDANINGTITGETCSGGILTISYATSSSDVIRANKQIAKIRFAPIGNWYSTNVDITIKDFNNSEDVNALVKTPILYNPNSLPSTPGAPVTPTPGGSTGGSTGDSTGSNTDDSADDSTDDSADDSTTLPAGNVEDYTDVAPNQWYYEAVEHVVETGYFKGVTEDSFAPQQMMTRAMFVTVLGRIAGIDEEAQTSGSDFTDVKDGQWYSGFVAWAAENDIVQGMDGAFNPNGNITREQMAVFLYRYAQYAGLDIITKIPGNVTIDTFKDANEISSWAEEAMAWAVSNGIMNGSGAGLDPKANATRAQVAQIVLNFDNFVKSLG